MSNHEKLLNQSKPKTLRNIEVGSFYYIFDKSKTGHPGLVVSKDDEHNRYVVVRFDSDKVGDIPKKDRGVRHITELKHRLSTNIVRSYARNRPFVCKRKDIGIKLNDLHLHEDDKPTIEIISNGNPEYSSSIKKPSRWTYSVLRTGDG